MASWRASPGLCADLYPAAALGAVQDRRNACFTTKVAVPLSRDSVSSCLRGFSSRKGGAKWVMQSGTGFSKRTESKAKHKLLTLEVSKASGVDTFAVFARKIGEDGSVSAWEEIGELLVEANASVETALKERRKKLLAASVYQYPLLFALKRGEDIEYGYKRAAGVTEGEPAGETSRIDVIAVDIKGKEPEASVPAILRADDGSKRPSLKATKAQYLNL